MGDSTRNNDIGEDWEALLADYALGVMPPEEVTSFERGLEECRTHVARAEEYASVAGALGMAVLPIEPATGHKHRFLSRLAATPQEAQPGVAPTRQASTATSASISPVPPGLPANLTGLDAYRARLRGIGLNAAATAAVAVLFVAVGLWALISIQQQKNQLNIPPSYVPFTIQGQGPDPGAVAVGFVNQKTDEVTLVARNLPQLQANEVYELWWIPPGFPNSRAVAAGTFNADGSGEARHTAHASEPVASYVAVAVTREPAPGGPTAKGPVVLLGQFPAR